MVVLSLAFVLFPATGAGQEPPGEGAPPADAAEAAANVPPAVAEIHALFADDRPQLGAAAFDAACATGDSLILAALWVDLRGLSTRAELEEWTERAAGTRCELLQQMIAVRAERAGQSAANRLAVHYERLKKVREDYWLPSRRIQEGAADSLGRDPDLLFDDRGLIYLRMGEPDEVAYAIGGSRSGMGNRVEGWAYDRQGARRIFFFSPVTALSVGNLDFRLLDAPWRAVGGAYGATQLQLVDMANATIAGQAESPLANLLLSFQGLDPYYATLAYRSMRGGTQLLQDLTEERQRTMTDVRYAVDSIPDAPAVRPAVRFGWERLRFLDPSQGRTVVWLLAGVRAGDLTGQPEPDGRVLYRLDLATAVRSGASVKSDSTRLEFRVPDELAEEDALIGRIPILVGTGEHPFTLMLRDANTIEKGDDTDGEEGEKPAGNWARGTISGIALSSLPEISDIAVAADSGGTWTRDGVTFLAVSPTHKTSPAGKVHLYFETYGMESGAAYSVEVRVVPEDSADEMWQMDAREAAFRLVFNSQMPDGGIGRHHLRLDLSDTAPGDYTLGLRIRDAATDRESLPATTPIVRMKPAR